MAFQLGDIIGKEGIKTDIQVSIAPSNFIYMGAALFVGIIAAQVVSKALFKG